MFFIYFTYLDALLISIPFVTPSNHAPVGSASFRFTALTEGTEISPFGAGSTNYVGFNYVDGNGDRATLNYTNADVASNNAFISLTILL